MSEIRDKIAREVKHLDEIPNLPPALDEIRLAGQALLKMDEELLQREHVRFGGAQALHFMTQYATGLTPRELGIQQQQRGTEMIYRITELNNPDYFEGDEWYPTVRYCGTDLTAARVAWLTYEQDCSSKTRLVFEEMDEKALKPNEMGDFRIIVTKGGE